MKHKLFYSLLFSSLAIFFIGCTDDKDGKDEDEVQQSELQLNATILYNNTPVDFSTAYLTEDGYRIKFSKVNFILTEFGNSEKLLFPSAVFKFENDPHLVWKGEGDVTHFDSLSGLVGVPATENHKDPSARSLDDPLSIMNTGDMHWGWNTGYIFLAIEGRADTTSDQSGSFDQILTYHVGLEDFLRPISFESVDWNKTSEYLHEFTFNVDLYTLFNGGNKVNVRTERSSHTNPGEEELSARIIDNFVSGIN